MASVSVPVSQKIEIPLYTINAIGPGPGSGFFEVVCSETPDTSAPFAFFEMDPAFGTLTNGSRYLAISDPTVGVSAFPAAQANVIGQVFHDFYVTGWRFFKMT